MQNETVAGTPADPTIKFTPLTLGGETYQLCYDFDAIAKAEAITGMALLAGVDWSNIPVTRIRAMLYASALKAHPDVKLAQFTPHIRHKNILAIQIALGDAWTESVPEKEEDESHAAEDASAQNASAQNPPVPEPETAQS
jgi:hypothetical protein